MAKHLTDKQKKKIKDWYNDLPKETKNFLLAEALRMFEQSIFQEELLRKEESE